MRLDQWEKEQPPVSGVDQSNTPLDIATRPYIRSEVLDEWRAKRLMLQVKRDLGVYVELGVDLEWTMGEGEGRKRYLLLFTINGVYYKICAGDLFAEVSMPYGWKATDDQTHFIGVDEFDADGFYRGRLRFLPIDEEPTLQNGRSLRFAFVPQERPVVSTVVPAPGSYPPPPGFYWGKRDMMGQLELMPIPGEKRFNLSEDQISVVISEVAKVLRS